MTYTLPVYASEDRTYLTFGEKPGSTPAFLSFNRDTGDEHLCVDLPVDLDEEAFYVEAVCLDYEFVDGGFDLVLYPSEEACLDDVGDDGFGAVEVYVAF